MLASIVKVNKPQETVQGLGQNGKQSGSGPVRWPDANIRTAGVESKPKSFSVTIVEHGNAANLARSCDRADLTARRVRRRSIGRTEEAKASV
jgi:hypothetical protein